MSCVLAILQFKQLLLLFVLVKEFGCWLAVICWRANYSFSSLFAINFLIGLLENLIGLNFLFQELQLSSLWLFCCCLFGKSRGCQACKFCPLLSTRQYLMNCWVFVSTVLFACDLINSPIMHGQCCCQSLMSTPGLLATGPCPLWTLVYAFPIIFVVIRLNQ